MKTLSTSPFCKRYLPNITKAFFCIVLCLIGFSSICKADVLRVNNQLTTNQAQKIFATIQEAHDLGKAGDTLMIEGSPINYNGATLTKRLVLIGTGYFLDQNQNTQANQLLSQITGYINLNAGSEGTFLIGLVFSTGFNSRPSIAANNITVMRCLFLSYSIMITGNRQNITIIQNYFDDDAIGTGFNTTFSNVIFNNNFVRRTLRPGAIPQLVFSQVNNNIFIGFNSNNPIAITTSSFRSNIVASTATLTISSNTVQNNLVLGEQLKDNGNQTYVAAQLFVGTTGNSTDGQYRLKTDSPYLTAGFQGTQPGIFGGTVPYVLSGLPPVPTIFDFSADTFGSKQNGLSIQIKAKSNF